ncbi:MAG: hypothetical protein KJ578_03270 [Bacteroidetes bacterium]|nr:hypothetical protein [Bacteroidota bacterium]
MLPGPTLIFACPECGQKVANESLMSGNTFGARYFSDGKRIAPMLPEFPDLIRCSSCDCFYFLHEQEPIDELYPFEEQSDVTLEEIDQAKAPGLDGLVLALQQEVARKKENEIAIRLDLWRAFNDRTRNGKSLFLNENDKHLYHNNCEVLIALIEPKEDHFKLTLAELYRNLSRFEACLKLINSLENPEWDSLKKQFITACNQGKTTVFELLKT